MTYPELKEIFCNHESQNPTDHLTAHIVFTEDSYNRPYTRESRTYVISSDNKAFRSSASGYSIFGECLDGTDSGVRLEGYMADEHGGPNGWKVEDCCLVGDK